MILPLPHGWAPVLRDHWDLYLIDGALLGLFMFAACLAVVLVEHPDAPLRRFLARPWTRRLVVGLAMGITAIALIESPWGRRTGAHMNPAVTLSFLALDRVRPPDAAGYVLGQLAGGLAGVLLARGLLGRSVAHPAVNFAVTAPGPLGPLPALAAEAIISFLLFIVVLTVSNRADLAPYASLCVGVLLALYITAEAPLSGMSINPSRTLASAIPAGQFRALWVYLLGPVAGMLLAAAVYACALGPGAVLCAKLHHPASGPCHFLCRFAPNQHADARGASPHAAGGIEPAPTHAGPPNP